MEEKTSSSEVGPLDLFATEETLVEDLTDAVAGFWSTVSTTATAGGCVSSFGCLSTIN